MKRKSNKHNPTVKQELEKMYQEFKASLAQRPADDDRTTKSFLSLTNKIQKHILEYERRTFTMGSDWNDKEKKALMDAKDAAVKIHEAIGRENAGWLANRYFTNFRVPRLYAEESAPHTPNSLCMSNASTCIESPVEFDKIYVDKSITCGYYVEDSPYEDEGDDDRDDRDVAKKNDIVMDLDSVSNLGEALKSKHGGYGEDDDIGMCCDSSANNLDEDVSMDICASGSGAKRPASADTGPLGKRPNTSLPWDEMVADMAEPNRLKLREFGEKIDRGVPYWNGEIQALLEQQCQSPEEYRKRAEGIMELYGRFCDAALTFFKKGIVKYYASGESMSNSGIAGGVKFKGGNIFFKLCVYDEKVAGNAYEDDIEVMKAANLEIQGLSKYMSCDIEGLYFPMMAVLDYMGFRVVASSVLPVSQNKSSDTGIPGANGSKISDTIVYGTENGGKDYFFCEKANSLARSTASILGIKEHEVKGSADGEVRKLWTAADTEM